MVRAVKWTGAGLLLVLLLVLAVALTRASKDRSLHGKEVALTGALFRMRDALDEHMVRTGTCPDSLKMLESGYLPGIPVDPFTESASSWQFTKAKKERGSICDVRSGSTLVARNGSRYADW